MKNSKTFIIIAVLVAVIGVVYYINLKVKVTGVVTYFYNQNFGQKPDVGAEVYFLDADRHDIFDFKSNWTYSKHSPNHLLNRQKIAELKLKELKNEISSKVVLDSMVSIESSEIIDRNNAINYFKNMMGSDNNLKSTTNGLGEFKIDLAKGRYYVLVVFANRDAIYLTSERIDGDKNLGYSFREIDMDL
jgi:hypothetical protein